MGALDIDKGQVKNIYAIAAKLGMVDRSSHEDALHELVQGQMCIRDRIISCILYTPFDDCGGSPFFPVQR